MDLQEVPLERIDIDDETFRISEDLDPVLLQDSLREVGQLHPVTLLARPDSRPVIVSGFRRLRALRRAGSSSCLARFLPAEPCSSLEAFRIALWDNVAHRTLAPLEKARALFVLKNSCAVSAEEIVSSYLPILGLDSHKNVLHLYLRLHLLDPALRKFVTEGSLAAANAERLAGMSQGAQSAAAALFARARFSASLQRRMLDLAEDLAAMDGTGIENVFAQPEVAGILSNGTLTPFERGEAVFGVLYRRRNPRLSAAESRFKEAKDKLGLPGFIRLAADPYFERPRVHVEFEASSAAGFREIGATIQRAGQSSALAELFRVK